MRERWQRKDAGDVLLKVGAGYALLGTLATALALALREGMPWVHPAPWLTLGELSSVITSGAMGLVLAGLVIASTRLAVARLPAARRLHDDLRPVAQGLTLGHILLLAGLSSVGEELLFRGLLTPTLGVLASSVLFGLAHQVKGPSRWVWSGWAASVGIALGAIFALTGSLVGPLVAHAVVNAVNLIYLRDHGASGSDRRAA